MRWRQDEDTIQAAILDALALAYPGVTVAHVPNGGARPVRIDRFGQRYSPSGKRLKRIGARAGFPDLILLWRGGAGFMEVKTEKGQLSPDQRQWRDLLRSLGHRWALVRSIDDALSTVKIWTEQEEVNAKCSISRRGRAE